MLLSEPPPSRWELHGRLFGAELRIRPLFWASCFLMGIPYYQYPKIGGWDAFLFWNSAVLISFLTHETSHLLVSRLFGVRPCIVLSGLGGQVYGLEALKRWQRVLVLLAGSLGNLLLFGILWLATSERTPLPVERLGPEWSKFIVNSTFAFMLLNALWCLLNVLPLWPLDGGRIAVELGDALLGRRGQTLALLLSLVVSLLMTLSVVLWARVTLIDRLDPAYLVYFTFFCIMSLYCYVFWLVTFRVLWGNSPPLDESNKPGRAA